ncbi:11268_t:CDS:2, partial [Ambispora leptoticha]
FYNILQEIQTGNLSEQSKDIIQSKINLNIDLNKFSNTTHIVPTRQATFRNLNENYSISNFKYSTNLPQSVHLQEGACVMFLNNKLFESKICNRTIGIITKIIDNQNIEVTFPTLTAINKVIVQKETAYFEIYGKRASRQQFPIQNAFALTAHKVQGLTLPHITTSIDDSIFTEGQAYVAMSRATS